MTLDWSKPYAVRPERSRRACGACGLRLQPYRLKPVLSACLARQSKGSARTGMRLNRP